MQLNRDQNNPQVLNYISDSIFTVLLLIYYHNYTLFNHVTAIEIKDLFYRQDLCTHTKSLQWAI